MKKLALGVLVFASFAHAENSEFSTVVRCTNYTGAQMTVVQVQRRVVDIYTPNVRFEERLVSTVGFVDPGVSTPWVSGKIDSTVKDNTYVYTSSDKKTSDFELALVLDWSKGVRSIPNNGFVVEGTAIMKTAEHGHNEVLFMNCEFVDYH